MRQVMHLHDGCHGRDLNNDLVEDLVGPMNILNRAGVIPLVTLSQGLDAQGTVGEDLVLGIVTH